MSFLCHGEAGNVWVVLRAAMAGLGLCLFSGCALLGVRGQVRAIENQAVLAVQVLGAVPAQIPTYAVALGDSEVLALEPLGSDQMAVLLVPEKISECTLLVFADANQNRRFDRGEAAGILMGAMPVSLADPEAKGRLNRVRLGGRSGAVAHLHGLVLPRTGPADEAGFHLAIGEIAKPGEARFSTQAGEEGLWKPDAMLRQGHLGVYFLEPYDPARIPVLFVHGIGGSPQDFNRLMPSLDRSRFQAWFFYYPSGFRLGKVANALDRILELLQRKHGMPRMHMVAHSMGGLVARGAIQRLAARRAPLEIERFVSISTPWGGHNAASGGVRHLKYPVPSWVDIAPGSGYLKTLWGTPLPPETTHYLLYGYDTQRLPWLSHDNDGVIDESSALYPPAQAEAVRVFGIHADHVGILRDPLGLAKVNEFLSDRP